MLFFFAAAPAPAPAPTAATGFLDLVVSRLPLTIVALETLSSTLLADGPLPSCFLMALYCLPLKVNNVPGPFARATENALPKPLNCFALPAGPASPALPPILGSILVLGLAANVPGPFAPALPAKPASPLVPPIRGSIVVRFNLPLPLLLGPTAIITS